MPVVTTLRKSLFWVLCLGIALASFRFLVLPPEHGLSHMAHQLENARVPFFLHVFAGSVALALMPLQFWKGLRQRRIALHRWTGRVYALSILIGGVAGLIIALGAAGGWIGQSGFFLLAVFWLCTTAMAVWHARAGRISLHQRWIIRSAALTFAAVMLRLWLPLLAAAFGFETGYTMVAWLCWVPNLVVAEWIVRRAPTRRTVMA